MAKQPKPKNLKQAEKIYERSEADKKADKKGAEKLLKSAKKDKK